MSKSKKARAAPKDPIVRAILRLLIKLTSIILLICFIFTFIFGIYRLNDISMQPNLNAGDMLLYYRLDNKYLVGDTVVYHYDGATKIGRVVALAGDEVDIDENGLKVNGAHQYEPKIYKETLPFTEGIRFPVKVGEGEVFLLADNREKGVDSRLFGAVKTKEISGKIFSLMRRRGI